MVQKEEKELKERLKKAAEKYPLAKQAAKAIREAIAELPFKVEWSGLLKIDDISFDEKDLKNGI